MYKKDQSVMFVLKCCKYLIDCGTGKSRDLKPRKSMGKQLSITN